MCGKLLKSHGQPFHVPFGGNIDDAVPVDVASVDAMSVPLVQNDAAAIPGPIHSLGSTARISILDLACGSTKLCSRTKEIRGMLKLYQ